MSRPAGAEPGAGPVVLGIANVVVHVSDMDAALHFYRDGLGLTVRFDTGWATPDPMLALSGTAPGTPMRLVALDLAGPAGLALCSFGSQNAEHRPFEQAGTVHVGLRVEDVETLLRRLPAHGGLPFGTPGTVGPPDRRSRLAFVRDPDGNVVELVERIPTDVPVAEEASWTSA